MGVNHQFNQYEFVGDAFAFVMILDGHEQYVLTFRLQMRRGSMTLQRRTGTSGSQARAVGMFANVVRFAPDSPDADGTGVNASSWGNKYYLGTTEKTGEILELDMNTYTDDGALSIVSAQHSICPTKRTGPSARHCRLTSRPVSRLAR